jgi:hypothetical protein
MPGGKPSHPRYLVGIFVAPRRHESCSWASTSGWGRFKSPRRSKPRSQSSKSIPAVNPRSSLAAPFSKLGSDHQCTWLHSKDTHVRLREPSRSRECSLQTHLRGEMNSRQELWTTVTLVGNWFVGLSESGQPLVAGRISRRVGKGRYIATYSFIRDGVKVRPVLTDQDIAGLGWLLFDNVATWRAAFRKAEGAR